MAASVSRACFNFCRKSVKLGVFNLNRDSRILRPVSVGYVDCARNYSSKNEPSEEMEQFEFEDEDEAAEMERQLEKKRNKSRLKTHHFRVMNGMQPYEEPIAWFHHSIKYKKRMFGRYGIEGTDIPLGALWPSKEDLEDKKAFEACWRPLSIQTMMANVEAEKRKAEEDTRKRQEDLAIKYDKIALWKKELNGRLEKKKNDAEQARLKKERLVEEVRRMVGYNVDPRDEKFKLLLEQKEKEQKKKEKEEKKVMRAAKVMEAMLAKAKAAEVEGAVEAKKAAESKK